MISTCPPVNLKGKKKNHSVCFQHLVGEQNCAEFTFQFFLLFIYLFLFEHCHCFCFPLQQPPIQPTCFPRRHFFLLSCRRFHMFKSRCDVLLVGWSCPCVPDPHPPQRCSRLPPCAAAAAAAAAAAVMDRRLGLPLGCGDPARKVQEVHGWGRTRVGSPRCPPPVQLHPVLR